MGQGIYLLPDRQWKVMSCERNRQDAYVCKHDKHPLIIYKNIIREKRQRKVSDIEENISGGRMKHGRWELKV